MITLIDLLAMLFTAPYAFNVGTTEGKKKPFYFLNYENTQLMENLLRITEMCLLSCLRDNGYAN